MKSREVHQFGPFRFDPAQYELREGDRRTTLPPALNKLLLLLVSRPGELITREEIAATLWEQQQTVNITPGINMAVKRLRTQIGDNNGHGVFIETVVGVGYRFVAPVSAFCPVQTEDAPPKAETATLDTIGQVDDSAHTPLPAAEPESEPGLNPVAPAPMPAGPLVARPVRAMDGPILRLTIGLVLVVLLGGGALLYRSVQHRVDTPASADGAEVVDASLALSGRPLTYDEAEDRLSAQAISPSGTYLVYSDRAGLTLATLATGELRLLNVPSRIKISRISWYPDESAVLIAETAADGPVAGALHDDRSGVGSAESQSPSIWRVPLNGLPGIPLLDNAQQAEVSPDNRRLAYTSGGGDAVWIADANGRSPHKLISAADGETFRGVLWSATGRAVLADRHYKRPPQLAGSDLATGPSDSARRGDDRSFYESYDPESGALLARREDVSFDSATMTHDGALIFPINSATEPSSVAIVQTDKSTGAWLGRPRLVRAQRAFRITASLIAQLSASADGKALSALIDRSTTSVFTANLTETPGQPPRLEHEERLTHHTGTTYPTAWTPDSSAVIFDDGIGGPISIAAQAPGSAGQRVLAAARSPVEKFAQARVSPDGRWLLFLNLDRDSSQLNAIERVPLGGGLPQVVPTNGQVKDFRCSTSPAGRCVVREVEGRSALIYYQLDPVRGMGAELARTAWQPNVLGDWSISPDGTTVARADHDRQHPAIELVPLAESASGQRKSAAVRQIPVTGFGTVLAPNWSPDGHSFFVETYTDPTYNLLSVKLDGQATLLRRSPQLIWAIPSPDGKKIAFPGVTLNDRNVWLATIDLGRVRP